MLSKTSLDRQLGRWPRAKQLHGNRVLRLHPKLDDKNVEKNEVIAELMPEHVELRKRSCGALTLTWFPVIRVTNDTRAEVDDYVTYWTDHTELPTRWLLGRLSLRT